MEGHTPRVRISDGGLKLHPDTIKALLNGYERRRQRQVWPMWIATAALLIALAAWVG